MTYFKNNHSSQILFFIIFLNIFFSLPMAANGALIENLFQSMEAMSMGNAVTADPPGIQSIHFNPAGLTKLKGQHTQIDFISPSLKFKQSFNAPPNYDGIFGFTDDPVIGQTSQTSELALAVPFVDELRSVPSGVIAPTNFGLSYSPTPKMTFATSFYAPVAGGFTRSRSEDPGRFGGQQLGLQKATFLSPTVGYELTPSLSVGFGVNFSMVNMALNTHARAPNPILGLTRTIDEDICPALEGIGSIGLWFFGSGCLGGGLGPFESVATVDIKGEDSLVTHYNLGLLWEPAPWFGMGAVFRSESEAKISGQYTIRYAENFQNMIRTLNNGPLFRTAFQALNLPSRARAVQKGNVTIPVKFPRHFSLGTKIKPIDGLQLNLDWSWTDWGIWEDLNLNFDSTNHLLRFARFLGGAGLRQLRLPRGYESVGHYKFGMKYHFTERALVRLGYSKREPSVPKDKLDTVVALPELDMYGFGFGYNWGPNTNIDLSGAYLHGEEFVPANTSDNLNQEGIGNVVYNPFAGLDVNMETSALGIGLTVKHKF